MTQDSTVTPFPAQLLNWAGNRSGGVRRLFDEASGRPGRTVFETNLLRRLQDWSAKICNAPGTAPRILLLVGGPGNGKTEAIESTIGWLDESLQANGKLVEDLRSSFFPPEGTAVPRVVRASRDLPGARGPRLTLSIVQDASAVVGDPTKSASQLLIEELEQVQAAGPLETYLCCVNRGVLDDALIEAIDTEREGAQRLLEGVARAVSLTHDATSCWPLTGFPDVAVWPMDTESLLLSPATGGEEPARRLFRAALDEGRWPARNTCSAGTSCPFCGSRERLVRAREEASLLKILRWYELASGKRWSFRDLFSLTSYLLAGHRTSSGDAGLSPCDWAAKLAQLDEMARRGAKPSREQSTAIYQLVAAQYQHALFSSWERESGTSLLREVKELDLVENNTVMGLVWFLASRRSAYLPAMVGTALDGLSELLDPALTDPDTEVQATTNTKLCLRDIDVRFSRSVAEGTDYIRRLQILSQIEIDLLDRLAKVDTELSIDQVRRKRPSSATYIQRFIRDFACRIVRRTIGTRTAAVLDESILAQFQRALEATQGTDLDDVAQEVEQLLNHNQDFEISLTTTFGQPLPPAIKRATLVVPSRSVRPLEVEVLERPASSLRFLLVGDGKSGQPIALTYELFKAVKELERGMSVASLPRAVLALLDTTRARLSGPIVRDPLVLDRARIKLGSSGVSIVQRRTGFSTRKEGGTR